MARHRMCSSCILIIVANLINFAIYSCYTFLSQKKFLVQVTWLNNGVGRLNTFFTNYELY